MMTFGWNMLILQQTQQGTPDMPFAYDGKISLDYPQVRSVLNT